MVFDAIKRAFSRSAGGEDAGNEYLEIDLGKEETQQKVFVKLFALKDYEEVNNILNFLREGYTIAVIDIKTLRQRDPIELKRAISKIKKTSDAMEGNIAGFGENVVIVTPSFAKIHKEAMPKPKDEKKEFTSRWD
ncbi:MAG TPA: cell division protein SepF [Candidatus Nanoarchaeia archaeon]|nr:cell division protein SepF [Candidatus Nanoarchaeia archaeon]